MKGSNCRVVKILTIIAFTVSNYNYLPTILPKPAYDKEKKPIVMFIELVKHFCIVHRIKSATVKV